MQEMVHQSRGRCITTMRPMLNREWHVQSGASAGKRERREKGARTSDVDGGQALSSVQFSHKARSPVALALLCERLGYFVYLGLKQQWGARSLHSAPLLGLPGDLQSKLEGQCQVQHILVGPYLVSGSKGELQGFRGQRRSLNLSR